jgi:beta-galactosidase
MLYSAPNKWLMQKYPPLAKADGEPDTRAYQGLFDPFYRGAFDVGLQSRIVHQSQIVGDEAIEEFSDSRAFARRHPVLVVPGLYLADDATLAWLRSYATSGGHLVLGPRTGYADEEGRARSEAQPASLTDLAGVSYEEFSNLSDELAVIAGPGASSLSVSPGAAALRWVDALTPTAADVLVMYDHPHFGRWPAVTTRDHGRGRITCVGTVPNPVLARDLFRWLVPHVHAEAASRPKSVTVSKATSSDGRRLAFAHNWSWLPADMALAFDCTDPLSDTKYKAGAKVTLQAWDVRVFVHERVPGP